MQKNVAGQKWTVFAFDNTTNIAKTGDAANITGGVVIDGASAATITDSNPTELESGHYVFDITQGESNGNQLTVIPVSSTTSISVIGVPGSYVTTPANMTVLSIDASGYTSIVNIEGVSALSQIQTAAASALTAYDPPTKAEMDTAHGLLATGSAISALNNISIAEVSVQCASSLTVYGTAQASAISALNNISIAQVAVQCASALTVYGAATGAEISALNDISQATVQTAAAAALTAYDPPTKTELDSGFAALNDLSQATAQTAAAAALTAYDPPTKGEMDTAHALLATPSQVNAQVLDVMNVDTFAEPGQGAPAATASIFAKINYMYKGWRNKKTSTASAENVYNNAGAVIDQKRTISDDGSTFTKGKMGTGA